MTLEEQIEKLMQLIIKLEKYNFSTKLTKEEADFILQQLNEDYIALEMKLALEINNN